MFVLFFLCSPSARAGREGKGVLPFALLKYNVQIISLKIGSDQT
jgi:hypothetical protein